MRNDRTSQQLLDLLAKPEAERLLHKDRSFRHSVLFEFVAIGEEAARISEELRLRHPGIPWRKIGAFRNRIAHGYFDLSQPLVWQLTAGVSRHAGVTNPVAVTVRVGGYSLTERYWV